MTVKEMKDILKNVPDEEEITVIYPEDGFGDDIGATIDGVAYIIGKKNVRGGVYIKLE